MFLHDLENRLEYTNLRKFGWEVSENSAIPPIFTDEYILQEAERIFEVKITEPLIIIVDVLLPRPQKTI